MAQYLSIRDGGKTNEEGFSRFFRRSSNNGQGQMLQADMLVTQHSTANLSVDINVNPSGLGGADLAIAYQNYIFYTWIDSLYNLAIANNVSGNPRIDAVVAYVDLTVVSAVSNNNPGALKFMDVQGTPNASPVAPTNAAIQTAVGAGNPFYQLSVIAVANNPTNIVNANITDSRTRFLLGNSGAIPPFAVNGQLYVQNGLGVNWIVPPGITAINSLYATCLTAPAGSGLTLQLYDVTQSRIIGTVTIPAGATTAIGTSMTNPIVNTGDVVRFDCTAVGSTTPGSDVLVQPSA
jgi:hypothetical protein